MTKKEERSVQEFKKNKPSRVRKQNKDEKEKRNVLSSRRGTN